MKNIHEIQKPAGSRPAGLSAGLTGASFGGVSATTTPPQSGPPPGMSQAEWYNNKKTRDWYSGRLQPPTTAPGEQATEGGKRRRRKMFEELFMEAKKRSEGGKVWPGELPYKGEQKPLDDPDKLGGKLSQKLVKPEDDTLEKTIETAKDISKKIAAGGGISPDDVKKIAPKSLQRPIQRYPTTPYNRVDSTQGDPWRESILINAFLQLQETQGNNLFQNQKKVLEAEDPAFDKVGSATPTTHAESGKKKSKLRKMAEGFGFPNKDARAEPKGTERGIGDTIPNRDLTAESGKFISDKKKLIPEMIMDHREGKKRTEGGQEMAGAPPSGGKLSSILGGSKDMAGAMPSGGKLSQMLGGGGSPTASSSDKDIEAGGGDFGGGGASGDIGGSKGGGGKEGSTSPVSSGISTSDTTVVGGPKQPPSGPTPAKTEGGKKRVYSRH